MLRQGGITLALPLVFVLVSVTFEGSYNLASLLILASYVFFFSKQVRQQITLSRPEKLLIIIAALYVLSFIMEVLLHDVKPRILDAPAKVLLLMPALLLCNALRPGRQQLIYSFMFSAVLLLMQSVYEKYYLGVARVNGDVNAIQYGAIAIAIGAAGIALCATRNTSSQRNFLLYVLCCLLCCGALYAGILSRSRGSIITLPLLALCLIALQAYKFKISLKKLFWYSSDPVCWQVLY
ncbi:hypothetical protein [Aliamphritea spongicola]|nr:hypothetical protein [Aliamphritea spongicola]